jgi:Leucine-rich repeat (LRR) protein
LIKKKVYKHLVKVSLVLFVLLSVKSNALAQLLDSTALDTASTFTLAKALRQEDPLLVYKLSLKKLKLHELPAEIYKFKNIQHLIVSKNKIKVFPPEMIAFKYLQILDMSSNKMEIIPKELGSLIYLKEIYFNQNKIVSIPPEIKFLKELKYLDLWGNEIGVLPHEIGELSETLEEIDMRVIFMSNKEHKVIKELLPNTKIRFSKACDCGF